MTDLHSGDERTLPESMVELNQWICWRETVRDGKTTKVPIDPRRGGFASTTDSTTWVSFEDAWNACERLTVDGLGFVFTDADDLVGIDLDDCRDPDTGKPDDWAINVVDQLASYTEISPSGSGYHVILRGELPPGRNRSGKIEMYDSGRFFTVTGDHVSGTPTTACERTDVLRNIHSRYFRSESESPNVPNDELGEATDRVSAAKLSDSDLIARAKSAKNGEKFTRLWRGSTAGYESHSEADMALCCHLAFWTGGDAERIDHLFRQSGLMREKWDTRHYADGSTYGEKTTERAIKVTDDVYDPEGGTDGDDIDVPTTHPTRQRDGSRSSDQLRARLTAAETTIEHLESRVKTLDDELEKVQHEIREGEHLDRSTEGVTEGDSQSISNRLGDRFLQLFK